MIRIRAYCIALAASVSLNIVLIAAIWLYIHFAATLDLVETAVSFF